LLINSRFAILNSTINPIIGLHFLLIDPVLVHSHKNL
jgi:hypothetical protein